VQEHGNASPALRVLGGTVASKCRGQGDLHGGARAVLVQGIDPLGRGRSGGEVTVQEVVGGARPRSGILGGHGDVPRRHEVAGSVSARWGQAKGPAGQRPLIRLQRIYNF
jgi:hypothetical protein